MMSNQHSLEEIIRDLLNEVFGKTVSIEYLTKHLKFLGGIDLECVPVETLLTALKNNELPQTTRNGNDQIGWRNISFGCDETLCHCLCLDPNQIGIDPSREYEEKLDMCAYLLAVGLLAQASRMQNMQLSDYLYFNKIMHTLYFYCNYSSPAFDVEHHIERLLKHIYRPGCP
tara:strand:- start:634897 stop:635412 length:516 start_codon:yes stop_codon:yes gene_type:complete